MVMKAVVETLEDVAEPFRDEYKKIVDPTSKKEVFVLDVDSVDPLPGVRALKDENAKRRIDNTKLSEQLKVYAPLADHGGIEKVLEVLVKLPELEAAAKGKLDEAAISNIVEGRVKQKVAPLERELGTWKTKAGEFEKENTTLKSERNRDKVLGEVRKVAKDLKVLDNAIEDVELLGERQLEINADGNVVVKESGLSIKDWLQDLQPKRPHWWGTSGGGGAQGTGNRTPAGGRNPWTDEHWNVTEQTRLVQADRARAQKMAEQAGTSIGGKRPAKKK